MITALCHLPRRCSQVIGASVYCPASSGHHCHLSSLHAIPIWPLSSFLVTVSMSLGKTWLFRQWWLGWSRISSIFTDFGNSSTVCRVWSVTSRCPPDYSVTDKTAPHKFLFWPRVQVNHPPGQGARVTCWPSLVILFSFPTFLVMALFRVQGWHRLDRCPVLHLMVSSDFPYFLEVRGILSKLCWLNLIFDESLLSTLAIDQNRQSFSPRQQYSVTLCFD